MVARRSPSQAAMASSTAASSSSWSRTFGCELGVIGPGPCCSVLVIGETPCSISVLIEVNRDNTTSLGLFAFHNGRPPGPSDGVSRNRNRPSRFSPGQRWSLTEDVHAADALVDATKAKRLVMVAATSVITTASLSLPLFPSFHVLQQKGLAGRCDRFSRLLVRFAGNPH